MFLRGCSFGTEAGEECHLDHKRAQIRGARGALIVYKSLAPIEGLNGVDREAVKREKEDRPEPIS